MRAHNRLKNIINHNRPVLVDFYADWCQPCKQMQPLLNDLRKNLKDNIRIVKVNVDKNPSIASHYNVKNIPTLILFKSGEIQWTGEGIPGIYELTKIVKKHALS